MVADRLVDQLVAEGGETLPVQTAVALSMLARQGRPIEVAARACGISVESAARIAASSEIYFVPHDEGEPA